MDGVVIEILERVGIPALTAIGGWFASVWRNKQRKENYIRQSQNDTFLMFFRTKCNKKTQKLSFVNIFL